ncbi:unnamed protein product [Mesocestoides corti]|uniref:RRM domain-containing protein n=1 Tax=Mesocestoides corti TaxID=53468 RepID=A0A0R3UJU8_MESCO|nr:unnamed protein product [Mesocestoides corti]
MWQDASIGCLLPSSNNVRLQSQEEIKKKLQQMRQQISSSSRLQTLKTEIDAATKDLNLAADNALLRANDHLTLIKKQETVTLEKAARKLFECWEEFKQLEQDSAHIRGCGKLAILLKYRQRARALIEGVKGIENLTDGFASPLRLMSVSTVFKMLSARLESTRLVYVDSINNNADVVDDDWRSDALASVSSQKSKDGGLCQKEAACQQVTGSAYCSRAESFRPAFPATIPKMGPTIAQTPPSFTPPLMPPPPRDPQTFPAAVPSIQLTTEQKRPCLLTPYVPPPPPTPPPLFPATVPGSASTAAQIPLTPLATPSTRNTTGLSSQSSGTGIGYRVFFMGMKANVTKPDLREAFSVFGHVGEIRRFLLPDGVHTNGQGFVTLDSLSAANSALAASPISIRTSRIIVVRLEMLKEPTHLVYATTIPAHSDFVDEDWRWDASGPFSVEKSDDTAPWSEEAADNQTADLAGWLKKTSATAKEKHGVDASLHCGGVDPGYRVFFTGMKANVTEPDLRKAFSLFGHVGEIQRFLLPDGVHRSGEGFVTLDSLSAANLALVAPPICIGTSRIKVLRMEKSSNPFGPSIPDGTSRKLHYVKIDGARTDISLFDLFFAFIQFGRIVHIHHQSIADLQSTSEGDYVAFDSCDSSSAALAAAPIKVKSSTLTLTMQSPARLPWSRQCYRVLFSGFRKKTSSHQLLEHFGQYGSVAKVARHASGNVRIDFTDITSAIVASLDKVHEVGASELHPVYVKLPFLSCSGLAVDDCNAQLGAIFTLGDPGQFTAVIVVMGDLNVLLS